MNINHLEEFVVFSQRRSFSKASAELHMTQSCLSKHIHQLETELGFPLVRRYGNKVEITAAGGYFLNGLVPLLEKLDGLKQESFSVHESSLGELLVLEPPYSDIAGAAMFELLTDFKDRNPNVIIKFTRIHGSSTHECLLSGKLDLLLEYRYGNKEELLEGYRSERLIACPLLRLPVLLWCDRQHFLAGIDEVTIGDLRNVPIMTSSDVYSPMRSAIVELCEKNGFEPKMTIDASTLKVEYLFASTPESVYLLPEGLVNDIRMLARKNMVFLSLKDVYLESFLILGPDTERSGSLKQLHAYLKDHAPVAAD